MIRIKTNSNTLTQWLFQTVPDLWCHLFGRCLALRYSRQLCPSDVAGPGTCLAQTPVFLLSLHHLSCLGAVCGLAPGTAVRGYRGRLMPL